MTDQPDIHIGDIVTVDAPRHPLRGERCDVVRVFVNPQQQRVAELRRRGAVGFNAYTFPVTALTMVERALIPETSPPQGSDHQPGDVDLPRGPPRADVSSLALPAVAQSAAGPSSSPTKEATVPRGRPRKTENAELAQSDEALESQLREVRELRLDKDDKAKAASGANARYRTAIKLAIKIGGAMGLTGDDVVWLMNAQDRTPEEIDAETVRRNKLATLMKLPIGTQLGMFEGGVSVATRIEDTKMATADPTMAGTEQEAHIGGRKSYDLGMDEADNPYKPDDPRNAAWLAGRNERKGEVAKDAGEALSRPHTTPATAKDTKKAGKNGAAPPPAEPAAETAGAPASMF